MSKITGLDRPNDLLIKLIREASRLRFETDEKHRLDHFFNFSVTANSLRDWCAEALYPGSSNTLFKKQKKSLNLTWDKVAALNAAKDIANSAKHFNIRQYVPDVENTKSSASKQVVLEFLNNSSTIDIAFDNLGREKAIETPSFEIAFTDDSKMGLDQFIIDTVCYWMQFFDENSIYRDPDYQASLVFFELDSWPVLLN
jgi:hypothetical protein